MSRFMAAIYDRFMRDMEALSGAAWRAELLTDVTGDVLEVGAGTGRNLDHYPAGLRLVLSEPDPHMRERLTGRARAVGSDARVTAWPADAIDAPDASFDAVVCTLVLCSVPDVPRALAEMRRVLRPGGRLLFIEHVLSSRPSRAAWQRRLEPAWRLVAGNCHLCRETDTRIAEAGFEITDITRESARKALPIVREVVRGVAIRSGQGGAGGEASG
jgi:ubiquinone/menaquinone biosynthesis C-methylase UbiE